jgi:hypothetical protein
MDSHPNQSVELNPSIDLKQIRERGGEASSRLVAVVHGCRGVYLGRV